MSGDSDKVNPMTEIQSLLRLIMAGNQERIHAWLREGNVLFHGVSPQEMVEMGMADRVVLVLRQYAGDSQIFRG